MYSYYYVANCHQNGYEERTEDKGQGRIRYAFFSFLKITSTNDFLQLVDVHGLHCHHHHHHSVCHNNNDKARTDYVYGDYHNRMITETDMDTGTGGLPLPPRLHLDNMIYSIN